MGKRCSLSWQYIKFARRILVFEVQDINQQMERVWVLALFMIEKLSNGNAKWV